MTMGSRSTKSHGWLARRRTVAVAAATALLSVSLAVWATGKGESASTEAADRADTTAGDETAPAKPDTVRISIQTVPPRKAMVKWGRKSLGTIPVPRALVVDRPRDSGPLDLVIRASGFLPVHTRAYTFSDSRVAVKLTPPSEKNTLFGYREEPAPNPDAGAPAPVPAPDPAPALPYPAP
jgi:hypothetical protein